MSLSISSGIHNFLQNEIIKILNNYETLLNKLIFVNKLTGDLELYDKSDRMCYDENGEKITGKHDCGFINYTSDRMKKIHDARNKLTEVSKLRSQLSEIERKAYDDNLRLLRPIFDDIDELIEDYEYLKKHS